MALPRLSSILQSILHAHASGYVYGVCSGPDQRSPGGSAAQGFASRRASRDDELPSTWQELRGSNAPGGELVIQFSKPVLKCMITIHTSTKSGCKMTCGACNLPRQPRTNPATRQRPKKPAPHGQSCQSSPISSALCGVPAKCPLLAKIASRKRLALQEQNQRANHSYTSKKARRAFHEVRSPRTSLLSAARIAGQRTFGFRWNYC